MTKRQSSAAEIIGETKAWIRNFVVHHQLCPFAKHPYEEGRIRYVVETSTELSGLLERFATELYFLANTSEERIDTSFIIHPQLLNHFLDYNDFLGVAETFLSQAGLTGVVQLASFHPNYQFSGTEAGDPENRTNRSPYPMLHLLREQSVERAVEAFGDTSKIPIKNIQLMERLFGS